SANTPIVTVSPGNMVFLDVVDPDGNSAENVRVNLHDAAGTLVGSLWNDIDFLAQNDSGIVGTEKGESLTFYVPWNTFPPHAAPETVFQIDVSRTEDMGVSSQYTTGCDIRFTSGSPYYMNLYSYSSTETTALTVPANYFGVYVDPKWANRTDVGYVTTPALTLYFNKKGSFDLVESLTTIPTGEVRLYEAFSPDYVAKIGLEFESGGNATSANPVTISDVQTEYVLCRVPLQQLSSRFNADGTYTYKGVSFSLAQDTVHTHALLVIQSGAMLSAVIPDADGYVEFYLDKATRKFALDYDYSARSVADGSGGIYSFGSGFSASGTGGTLNKLIIEPVAIPEDEVILTQVPAGTYTLTYENLPDGYEAPKTTTLTVTDSQEVQYLQLMLEKAALLGDVDENGSVNAADAALLLKAASLAGSGGASGLNADQEQSADVNGDGVYNASDAALILQYAAYIGSGGTMTLEAFLNAH
ncbi:MAG: hypothetical protein IJ265_09535, partial [Oscillospiraceae bacterium]|nr:hypothetical protein [Oscillospiraceae bacterium]